MMKIKTPFLCCLLSLCAIAGCAKVAASDSSSTGESKPRETPSGNVLVAYFSRPGENWQVGNVEKGNTEVFAEYIIDHTGFDHYKIEPETPYPNSYDEMLQVCQKEQSSDARPKIKEYIDSIEGYDTILLGHPIWNAKAPNILLSFFDHYDFSGKRIITFVTHGGSGFGSSVSQIANYLSDAKVESGLAIEGTKIRSEESKAKALFWLDSLSLESETKMKENVLNRYKAMQQAMVDQDMDFLNEVILDGTTFRHMSGKVQTKEEYLKDIEEGLLDYQAYTIENEAITIDGDDAYIKARVTLTANAYGAQGTWPFDVNAHFQRINGTWYYTN